MPRTELERSRSSRSFAQGHRCGKGKTRCAQVRSSGLAILVVWEDSRTPMCMAGTHLGPLLTPNSPHSQPLPGSCSFSPCLAPTHCVQPSIRVSEAVWAVREAQGSRESTHACLRTLFTSPACRSFVSLKISVQRKTASL